MLRRTDFFTVRPRAVVGLAFSGRDSVGNRTVYETKGLINLALSSGFRTAVVFNFIVVEVDVPGYDTIKIAMDARPLT